MKTHFEEHFFKMVTGKTIQAIWEMSAGDAYIEIIGKEYAGIIETVIQPSLLKGDLLLYVSLHSGEQVEAKISKTNSYRIAWV